MSLIEYQKKKKMNTPKSALSLNNIQVKGIKLRFDDLFSPKRLFRRN